MLYYQVQAIVSYDERVSGVDRVRSVDDRGGDYIGINKY